MTPALNFVPIWALILRSPLGRGSSPTPEAKPSFSNATGPFPALTAARSDFLLATTNKDLRTLAPETFLANCTSIYFTSTSSITSRLGPSIVTARVSPSR
jgi:hypothetical protein